MLTAEVRQYTAGYITKQSFHGKLFHRIMHTDGISGFLGHFLKLAVVSRKVVAVLPIFRSNV